MSRAPITIGGTSVAPGQNTTINLAVGQLYTHEPLFMPVHVFHGKQAGPVLFVSAAIHGDELNGIEIVRRLVASKTLSKLRGTLIAVPIVNVLGVVHQSRYLPDRRDLNRCFPGSSKGSLAARMADLFMREVVLNSTHGIDLHTGAIHRDNIPQVRGKLRNRKLRAMADAFGASLILDSGIRDGSLRDAATEAGIPVLLFEGGEALRFNEQAIKVGLRGVRNVMSSLGMLPTKPITATTPFVARSSLWVRAPQSGVFRAEVSLGERVKRGQLLGTVADPFGPEAERVVARATGVLVGRSTIPLVHEGDALFHIASSARRRASSSSS